MSLVTISLLDVNSNGAGYINKYSTMTSHT